MNLNEKDNVDKETSNAWPLGSLISETYLWVEWIGFATGLLVVPKGRKK